MYRQYRAVDKMQVSAPYCSGPEIKTVVCNSGEGGEGERIGCYPKTVCCIKGQPETYVRPGQVNNSASLETGVI